MSAWFSGLTNEGAARQIHEWRAPIGPHGRVDVPGGFIKEGWVRTLAGLDLFYVEPLPEPTYGDSGEVECPWCGTLNRDLWEYSEGCYEFECGECERPLLLDVRISITYELRPIQKEVTP